MTDSFGKYYESVLYHLVYAELINAARYRGTVTYQEIATIMGLPLSGSYMGSEIGQMVGDISRNEAHHGRPMLSAIVVGVSGEPGKGFYGLAEELGKAFSDDPEGRHKFWQQEVQAVYQTWQRKLE